MKTIHSLVIAMILLSQSPHAFASNNDNWSAGLSYISENFFNETTQTANSSPSLIGTANYALDGGYQDDFAKSWKWSARLLYTPLPRSASGNTATVTMTQIKFLAGQDFATSRASGVWDWYGGLGILKEDYNGKGGTVQMSNGTGTAQMAVPGRSSTSLNGTQIIGVGYSDGPFRVNTEIDFENLFNDSKRTQNLVISLLYTFQSHKGRR